MGAEESSARLNVIIEAESDIALHTLRLQRTELASSADARGVTRQINEAGNARSRNQSTGHRTAHSPCL